MKVTSNKSIKAQPAAPLFQPQPLKWEEVDWRAIAQREEFQMLGLCNRHVQIDQTGRDWYGLPYLEDEVAAPLQGIPYVMPFRNWDEKELNKHLWELEFLGRGAYHAATERAYARYIAEQRPGARLWTVEQFFLRQVYLKVCLRILPTPRIARHYIKHWTEVEYAKAEQWEQEHPHQRKASPLEKFAQLDYIGRVAFALEGLIESCRQRLYFAKLEREHYTEQLTRFGMQTATSQARWAKVDQERETQRKQRLAAKRQNPEVVFAQAVDQLDMFGGEVAA
jgi:hypothetical protein